MALGARLPRFLRTAPPVDARQVRMLVGLLRSSRLTVLYGARGAGKTTLLVNGLLPLLRRQARAAAQSSTTEVVVHFDAWTHEPWPELQRVLRKALQLPPVPATVRTDMAAALEDLSGERGLRLILILDAFEQCLRGAERHPEQHAFTEDLIDALRRPGLQARILVAVREDARPLMDRLCRQLPDFDPRRIALGEPAHKARALYAAITHKRSRMPKARRVAPADIYADIGAVLERTTQPTPLLELPPLDARWPEPEEWASWQTDAPDEPAAAAGADDDALPWDEPDDAPS